MGVDISGRKPIIRSPKPAYPDWNTATEEEKDTYFEVSNKWEKENPGDYFRSNWWGWRPIHMMCEYVNEEYNLKFDMSEWGENSGAGLRTQKQCDKLVEGLDKLLNSAETIMPEDTETIYVCMGSWVDSQNRFIGEEKAEELNQQFRYTEILYGGVVGDDGEIYYSAHSCSKRHLERFMNFLRECGGFRIF
jgi:hypothetical protein